jgi:hypothetical protein
VFTARYALSSHIKHICFVFKGLIIWPRATVLHWGHYKESRWSTPSTYYFCWHTPPSSVLVYIVFQSSSNSVHKNVDSKNYVINFSSDNRFGLAHYKFRQGSMEMKQLIQWKASVFVCLWLQNSAASFRRKISVVLFDFQIMQSSDKRRDSVLHIFTDVTETRAKRNYIFNFHHNWRALILKNATFY